MRGLCLLVLLSGSCAAFAQSFIEPSNFVLVTTLYSAQAGRAFAGLLDTRGTVRFADCKAPVRSFTSIISVDDLSECLVVNDSAFELNGENLARIQKSLPFDLATVVEKSLDDLIAQFRAKAQLMHLMVIDTFLAMGILFFWRKPLATLIKRGRVSGAGVGKIGSGFTLGTLLINVMFLFQNQDVSFTKDFAAFEGPLFGDESKPVIHFSDGDRAVEPADVLYLYESLRKAILESVVRMREA